MCTLLIPRDMLFPFELAADSSDFRESINAGSKMKKSNPTILIVDDDANDLLFIQSAFKVAGVISNIQTISSGSEAIAYLMGYGKYSDRSAYGYPNFIITDLKMPGIDGFGLLSHIKLDLNSKTIPTVILSGSQDDDDIQKAYLSGAASYHLKPGNLDELRILVRTLYNYWVLCEVPATDAHGKRKSTEGANKIGARYAKGIDADDILENDRTYSGTTSPSLTEFA